MTRSHFFFAFVVVGSIGLAGYAEPSLAQNNDFQVNTRTDDNQTEPDIAALSGGGHVIVWTDMSPTADSHFYAVKAQIFNASGKPDGVEFLVHDVQLSGQFNPKVAGLNDGRFVVMWEDRALHRELANSMPGQIPTLPGLTQPVLTEISARLFKASGDPEGSSFPVNTIQREHANNPIDAIGLNDGGFVLSSLAHPWVPYVNVYDRDGGLRREFLVKTRSDMAQARHPALTALPDSGFSVVIDHANPPPWFVWQGRFDSSGNPDPNILPVTVKDDVSHHTPQPRRTPSAATNMDGVTFVAWVDLTSEASDDTAIKAQIIGDNGALVLTQDFFVNTTQTGHQNQPSVAALPNGNFVVAWKDENSGDGGDIRVRRFNASGTALDVEDVLFNTTTAGLQDQPSVVAGDGCGFLVAWRDESQSGADQSGSSIRARYFCDAPPVTACVEPPSGLIFWYSPEEPVVWPNPVHERVSDLKGIPSKDAPFVTDNFGGKAVSFNWGGINFNANHPTHQNFDDFTVQGWVRLDTTGKVEILTAGWSGGFRLVTSGGSVHFSLRRGPFVNLPQRIDDGEWHLVSISVDRDETAGGKMYIDGQLGKEFDPTPQQGQLSYRKLTLSNNTRTDVDFDEIMIFNRALSAEEIRGQYDQPICGAN